jgi:hypothetical protein
MTAQSPERDRNEKIRKDIFDKSNMAATFFFNKRKNGPNTEHDPYVYSDMVAGRNGSSRKKLDQQDFLYEMDGRRSGKPDAEATKTRVILFPQEIAKEYALIEEQRLKRQFKGDERKVLKFIGIEEKNLSQRQKSEISYIQNQSSGQKQNSHPHGHGHTAQRRSRGGKAGRLHALSNRLTRNYRFRSQSRLAEKGRGKGLQNQNSARKDTDIKSQSSGIMDSCDKKWRDIIHDYSIKVGPLHQALVPH